MHYVCVLIDNTFFLFVAFTSLLVGGKITTNEHTTVW